MSASITIDENTVHDPEMNSEALEPCGQPVVLAPNWAIVDTRKENASVRAEGFDTEEKAVAFFDTYLQGDTYAIGRMTPISAVCSADGVEVARRCPSCGEFYSARDWDNEGMSGELTEESLCLVCYESDLTYPSSLIRFAEGENEVVVFGDHNTADGEAPEWFLDLLPEPWTGRVYVHSSAWRGYYDTSSVLKGLVDIENGWVTGYPDDSVSRKVVLSEDLYEPMMAGSIISPKPLYWLFEPTSNVFSTATTIMCAEADAEEIKSWLNETFGLDKLRSALG